MKKIYLRFLAYSLSLTILSACGGGGSNTSTPTKPDVPVVVVTTCTNGATDFPTCTFFAAKLQTTVPTPAISPDSPEFKG
jgi:ABC-type glycerol-3-phosphate transport system substrate-binding protein